MTTQFYIEYANSWLWNGNLYIIPKIGESISYISVIILGGIGFILGMKGCQRIVDARDLCAKGMIVTGWICFVFSGNILLWLLGTG